MSTKLYYTQGIRVFQAKETHYSEERLEHAGLTFHRDQGVQYTDFCFRKRLRQLGVKQSFSNPGSPLDNAVAESFFACLKEKTAAQASFRDRRGLHQGDVLRGLDGAGPRRVPCGVGKMLNLFLFFRLIYYGHGDIIEGSSYSCPPILRRNAWKREQNWLMGNHNLPHFS